MGQNLECFVEPIAIVEVLRIGLQSPGEENINPGKAYMRASKA